MHCPGWDYEAHSNPDVDTGIQISKFADGNTMPHKATHASMDHQLLLMLTSGFPTNKPHIYVELTEKNI